MDIIVNDFDSNSDLTSHPEKLFEQLIIQLLSKKQTIFGVGHLISKAYHKQGRWLIVTPIYIQTTHNDALITGYGRDLNLDDKALDFIFNMLHDYFQSREIEFRKFRKDAWMIEVSKLPNITSLAPDLVLQKSLMSILAELDASHFWAALLTEIQMLFMQKTFNTQLSNLVNGVWLWGAGTSLPTTSRRVICESEYGLRLAKLVSPEVINIENIQSYKKNDIIFLQKKISNKDMPMPIKKLNKYCQKIATHWHYLNAEHRQKPLSWYQRIRTK